MQNLFVECRDPDRIVDELTSYHRAKESVELAPGWEFVPSYPTTLKVSPVRKSSEESPDFPRYWASIFSNGGETLTWNWILVVAENDVIDLALARWLSYVCGTTCIAVFSYDGADSYGYRTYTNRMLMDEFSREMEERPDYRANKHLETLGIPYNMCRFRDCQGPGWRSVSIDPLDEALA